METTPIIPQFSEILWGGLKALITALVLTPILRDIFRAYHIVDQPGLRKVHEYPIPRLGGMAIAAGFVIGFIGLHSKSLLGQILPGAGLIFLIGILDDFFNLPARLKFFGQIAAASLTYWAGLRLGGPPAISLPITVFWIVLATNAFNLIDGLDGLCAGLGATGGAALFVLGWMNHNVALECVTLMLIGAVLGFLFYNFSRATIFLGDSGALLIGFLLGCCGLLWNSAPESYLSFRTIAPLLAIWVPVTDLVVSIVRRRVAGRRIFSADRGHIHHRLLDHGLSARRAVLVMYLGGISAGAFALLLTISPLRTWSLLIFALFLAVTLAGVYRLRYSEFKWRH